MEIREGICDWWQKPQCQMVIKGLDWTFTSNAPIFNLSWVMASVLRICGPLTRKMHMNTYSKFFIQLILLHFKLTAIRDHMKPVYAKILYVSFSVLCQVLLHPGTKSKVCNKTNQILIIFNKQIQSAAGCWLWCLWYQSTISRENPPLLQCPPERAGETQVWEREISGADSQGRTTLTEFNECFPKQ